MPAWYVQQDKWMLVIFPCSPSRGAGFAAVGLPRFGCLHLRAGLGPSCDHSGDISIQCEPPPRELGVAAADGQAQHPHANSPCNLLATCSCDAPGWWRRQLGAPGDQCQRTQRSLGHGKLPSGTCGGAACSRAASRWLPDSPPRTAHRPCHTSPAGLLACWLAWRGGARYCCAALNWIRWGRLPSAQPQPPSERRDGRLEGRELSRAGQHAADGQLQCAPRDGLFHASAGAPAHCRCPRACASAAWRWCPSSSRWRRR